MISTDTRDVTSQWPATDADRLDVATENVDRVVRATEVQMRLDQLLTQAQPLGTGWAAGYAAVWALEETIKSAAHAWSSDAAREVVRHLSTPYTSLAVSAAVVLATGASNIVTTSLVAATLGPLIAPLVGGSGVLVLIHGARLAARYVGLLRQYKAGIPPFRARLQQEIERHALAALDRRRFALAGPRRPVPRHPFEELLPVHAKNIAAGWMRHLGELDATVLREEEAYERLPRLDPEQVHLVSSGYIGRVWSYTAETPELELVQLEEATAASGRRPLLFSTSNFPDAIIARANRRRIGLLTYDPWRSALRSANEIGARYLATGLRGADGLVT